MAALNKSVLKNNHNTKLIFFVLIICTPLIFIECGSKKRMTAQEKSEQVKNKLDKNKDRKNERAIEKAREAHYERQGPKTRARMEKRAAESEAWREKHLGNQQPEFWIRIKLWFKKMFRKLNSPDEGLDDNVTR